MVLSPLVRSIAALGTLFAISTACDKRHMVDPGNHPDADRLVVTISPARDSLLVGATLGLTATVTDVLGAVRTDQTVRWSSLAPNVATVDGVGLVTGIAAGTVQVVAMVGLGAQLHADTAVLLVQAGELVLSITPELAEITLGDSLRLEATLRTPTGTEVRSSSVQWSTSNQTVATISGEGIVTALSPGDATLTAIANDRTATAIVRVLPNRAHSISVAPANSGSYPGEAVQLVATVRDARGRMLPASNVTWSTPATNVVDVTPDGVVRARAQGAALITATVEGRTASATVLVFAVPAAAVSVTAPANSVPLGGRLRAIATARDSAGNVLSAKPVAWSSSNPSVAQVDAEGSITGLVVGSTSIHAIIDSKIGTLPISVVSATPTTISVLPATAAVSLGKTAQLTAEVLDQGGNIVSGTGVTWASANPSIATVTGSGLVTAVGAGTVDVSATAGALSAQSSIIVIQTTIASVSVSPAMSQIQIGGMQQLGASVADANGSQVPNAAIAWSSSNPAVVSVSALGVARGISPGNATITATSSGISGSASVAVSSPAALPVSSVTVTFNSPSLVVGQSTQATAIARNANGNTIAGKTVVWSSADAPLASVSAAGLVTAIAGGTATIVATIDGVLGYATISIGAPTSLPVHTVQLTLTPSTISAGQTATSNVILRDSLGRTLVGRTIGWTSNYPTVASVGVGGVITGVSAGAAIITAASEGKSGSASLTVRFSALPTVATVTVATSTVRLTPGQSTQATATARDSAGNVLAGLLVTWLSSNPAAAAVSATGLVTGVAMGATTITATAGGKSGSVAITVVNPATGAIVPATIDATGTADVTDALTAFFASVPDGSTIQFPQGAISDRNNQTLEGNGATIIVRTDGSGATPPPSSTHPWPGGRRHLQSADGSNIVVRRLTSVGANPNAGLSEDAYDATLEAQHAFEFSGVQGAVLDSLRDTGLYGDFAQHVTFRGNTFEPGRLRFVASLGANALVDDITIEGNTLVGRSMNVVVSPLKGSRRSRFRVLNNTSDDTHGSPLALMRFTRVDSLEVRGNVQALAASRDMTGVSAFESCAVVVAANRFAGAALEAYIQASSCR